jgi:hypothetical protein
MKEAAPMMSPLNFFFHHIPHIRMHLRRAIADSESCRDSCRGTRPPQFAAVSQEVLETLQRHDAELTVLRDKLIACENDYHAWQANETEAHIRLAKERIARRAAAA